MLLAGISALTATLPGGRGVGNSAYYPDTEIPANLALAWKASVAPAGSSPSNTLFSGELAIVAFGSTLYGINGDTGELRWQQELPEAPLGDIYLLDEQVVISTATRGVYGYDPENGAQIWKAALASSISNGPSIASDALLFATRADTIDIIARKSGNSIASISLNSAISVSPLRNGQSLLFIFQNGNMTRIENGITRWSARLSDIPLTKNPVTDGRLTLLNAANNTLYSLNTSAIAGAVRWKYFQKKMLPEVPAFDGKVLYLTTTDGKLIKLDAIKGKELWGDGGVDLPAPAVGGAMIIGDALFLPLQGGIIAVVEREKGTVRWQYRLGGPGKAADFKIGFPMVQGKHLLVAAADGCLYHFTSLMPDKDPPTFHEVLPTRSGSDFYRPPALQAIGAIIEDEGSGLLPGSVTAEFNGVDLTAQLHYDPQSGYYLADIPTALQPAPGLSHFTFTAKDYAGNSARIEQTFFVGASPNSERIPILINSQYLPQRLQVRPGTMLQWVNNSGGYRSVLADNGEFTSDTKYPNGITAGDSYIWIVPLDAKPGTLLPYHCRFNGKAGDGTKTGSGLAGLIEVVDPRLNYPGIPDAGKELLLPFPVPPR